MFAMTIQEPVENKFQKTIRSFVRREGRMTLAQKQALDKFWPKWGLELSNSLLNFQEVFGRAAPITLEIGFGDGQSLLKMAQANPDRDFIGIEVYRTGVAKLFMAMEAAGVSNIRVFCTDALEVLNNAIPDHSLSKLQLFFPDPWPKARHHKRRIVQSDFATLVALKLKQGGVFHMATDWQNYAEHMMMVMEQHTQFQNTVSKGQFAPRPEERPLTKFEKRGHRLGHGTWDLIYNT